MEKNKDHLTRWIAIALFGIVGVCLTVGGTQLVTLSGSAFYLLAGLGLLISAFLLFARRALGAVVFLVMEALTLLWALWEAGFHPWALLARIDFLPVLGLALLLPGVRSLWRVGSAVPPTRARILDLAPPTLLAIAVLLVVGSYWAHSFAPVAAATGSMAASDPIERDNDWHLYGNTASGDRFSPAALITPENAANLAPAWTFHTGDKILPGEPAAKTVTFQATPIKIGAALYFCTAHDVLFSLDVETGKELWRFDPHADTKNAMHMVCRGVSYAPGTGGGGFCDGRILMATLDNRLLAVDPGSGKVCSDFGTDGAVDLTRGMGKNAPGYFYTTSPPVVIGHTAVLGAFHMDNQSNNEPPGVIRAFDTRTGELQWAWEVLGPQGRHSLGPGENFARDTANAWTVFSADPENGLVFVPTGGPPPDYFGGLRTPEQDRYNDSIVALDATSGDVRWSFQISHHDLWDLDIASQPVVTDIDLPGGRRHALIVPTKRGEIFVLDRLTGKPIFGVVERPVPGHPVPGEHLSPTQPYTVGFPSFSPIHLSEADMWGGTLLDQMLCRIEFKRRRYDGQYTPPSLEGSIGYPDIFGVFNWGSVAVDPERQIMFVNPTWLPYLTKLYPRADADAAGIVPFGETAKTPAAGGLHVSGYIYPQAGTPYASSAAPFLSPLGFPCAQPPWGAVAVVDLRTQKIVWERPFGTTRDVAPLGLALPTGVFSLGGAVVTRGGVAFIGAAIDNYLRAYDVSSGRKVWQARLPAGGQATPMTYISAASGRQFVVIAAGGHGSMQTTPGDSLVAFAVPTVPEVPK